jgi:hypothetical protein
LLVFQLRMWRFVCPAAPSFPKLCVDCGSLLGAVSEERTDQLHIVLAINYICGYKVFFSSWNLKVWETRSSHPTATLKGAKKGCYLYTESNRHLMVTLTSDWRTSEKDTSQVHGMPASPIRVDEQ